MRQPFEPQLSLRGPVVAHPHARELEAIDQILKGNPAIAALVLQDLQAEVEHVRRGRPGLSGEQVVRAAIVKQMNGFSYKELHFHLLDSRTYWRFCGFSSLAEVPGKSALADNIGRVTEATWTEVNKIVLRHAAGLNVEDGRKVRIDPTVTETNIHHPTDNALLWDAVRVLTRLLGKAAKRFDIPFSDHTRRAKRRHFAIRNARNAKQREKPYRDLVKVTRKVVGYARRAVENLERAQGAEATAAPALVDAFNHYIELTEQVISQTERRVFSAESVPASEKVVSIFEPHTDVIRKDNRDTYYGHKLTLTGGASGLILDWQVEDGNPADATLAVPMLKRQRELYGRVPQQAAFDGSCASKENLRAAKAMGIRDVVFSKKRGLQVPDMARSTWVYNRLRRFRAGIEGIISFLKRIFGLDRCTWRGEEAFGSYVGASIVSANLLLLARHLIS